MSNEIRMTDERALADEYRPSMTLEVLHAWAAEAVARLRGEAAQGDYHEGLAEGIKIGRSEVMAEQQGQAVATGPYVDRLCRIFRLRPDAGDYSEKVLLDFAAASIAARPQPVAGDAVRALPAKWRSESTSDDQSSDYECGEHSARSECADELEAALSATPAAPAPVAGDWIDLVIRDVCELDPAEGPSSVNVEVEDLRRIVERHAPTIVPVAGDAVAALPAKWRVEADAIAEQERRTHSPEDYASPVRDKADELEAALAQDRASQGAATGVPEWFEDVRRCLDDVAMQQRAHGYDDGRMVQLLARMYAWLAAAPKPTADASDADIAAWVERHNMDGAISGTDARCAFEDAQTFQAGERAHG